MATNTPIVIAHRGASGYLPEHTLESAAFAYASGADFIEQDVILSKDDVLVVSHDIHIDTTTDVAERFPRRQRADHRYYAIDFTWEELRSLRVRERFDHETGRPIFPQRFPHNGGSFRLCTLEEEILLVQGLNRSTGRNVGLYPEFKAPAWHAERGKDLGAALLTMLARHGYTQASDNVFVQCFDPVALKRLRTEQRSGLRLIQLIGENAWREADCDYDALSTSVGLRDIATYAHGIGPNLERILAGLAPDGSPRLSTLVRDAHAAGLAVHPYTLRADALPPGVPTIDALFSLLIGEAGIDGLFTDQSDTAVRFLKR
ncbi:MAG TPA: glycerophosphodiester phosphodiesterase [Opitutaceae bacterium]